MYCRNCGADLSMQDRYPVCIICRKGKGRGDKYCAYCGAELSAPGAERCDACGRLTGPEDPKKPITPEMARFRPIYAALLSLVMPGMGQAMNYQLVKGVVVFLAYVLLNGFTSGPNTRSLSRRPMPSLRPRTPTAAPSACITANASASGIGSDPERHV